MKVTTIALILALASSTDAKSETQPSPLKWNHELIVTRVAAVGRILVAPLVVSSPGSNPTQTRYFVAFQVDVPIGSCIQSLTGQMRASRVYNGKQYEQLSPIGVNWYAPPANVCNQSARDVIQTTEMQTDFIILAGRNIPPPHISTKRFVITQLGVGPQVFDVMLNLSIPTTPTVTVVRIGNP